MLKCSSKAFRGRKSVTARKSGFPASFCAVSATEDGNGEHQMCTSLTLGLSPIVFGSRSNEGSLLQLPTGQ